MGGSFRQFQHLEPGNHQFTTRPGGKLRKTGTRIWIHSGECRGTHDSDDAKHLSQAIQASLCLWRLRHAGTQPEKILHFGNSAGTAGQVLGMAKNGGYYFNGGGELSFPSVNFGGNVQVGVFRRKASATYADGEFFFNGTTQIGSAQSGTSVPAIPSSGTREIILGAGRTGTTAIGNQLGNAVMHEVMLFSGSLTDFAIRRMEGYLAQSGDPMRDWSRDIRSSQARPLFGGSQSISLNPTNVPTDSTDSLPFMSIFDLRLRSRRCLRHLRASPLPTSQMTPRSSTVTSAVLLQPAGQGRVRITARQAGNAYFSAATPVVYNMKVLGKRSQTVTFTTPSEVRIDQALDLNASASSGLDANFSIVSGGNIASLSGKQTDLLSNWFGNSALRAGRQFNIRPCQLCKPDIPRKTTTQTGI